jgi:hypothetical protein
VILLGFDVFIWRFVELLIPLERDKFCLVGGGLSPFFFSTELVSDENKKEISFLDSSRWVKISFSPALAGQAMTNR